MSALIEILRRPNRVVVDLSRLSRPEEETVEALRFVYGELPRLAGSIAVRVRDSKRGLHGWAFDTRAHGRRKWVARCRFGNSLSIPADEWDGFGIPLVTWHATGLRVIAAEHGSAEALVAVAEAYYAGARRYGRWPIRVYDDWLDGLVSIAAHEARHLAQYDRDSGGTSEVECEEFAAAMLDAWKRARS